jgi:hypothetical protein
MQEYRHTLRIFNTYFFSTAAVLTRTRHIVMLPALFANNVIKFHSHFLGFLLSKLVVFILQENR